MIKPIFHLRPKENWMNDPNGPVFIQGQFHMFYQHNPDAPVWGNMTWGHAVSPDMVNWRRLPHALYPDMPYDKDGVFSGCCAVHDGIPHILYTGVYPESLCLATGDADGMNFTKYEGNPILTQGGRKLAGWRDPYVWPEDGSYRMLIGAGDGHEGFAEIYQGSDLINWSLIGRLAGASEYSLPDTMWECPVIMTEGDRAVVFISAPFIARTITGRYHGGKIEDGVVGLADLGDSMYAPNLVRHPDGRWILFGWQMECGDEAARAAQGWQGMLTLPREIRIGRDGLETRPAAEVAGLRERCLLRVEKPSAEVTAEPGHHYEVEADLSFNDDGTAIFELLRDESGNSVKIVLSIGSVTVLRGKYAGGAAEELKANILPREHGKLNIYVDGTSIEIYINERETLTTRAYPNADSTGFRAKTTGRCGINSLFIYSMKNCYDNGGKE